MKIFGKITEFFSELKLCAVNEEDYENSKYLYKTLKMQNLGDLNDLYNTQDVILLTEIIESRFQSMQDMYSFNSRNVILPVQWVSVLKEKCQKLF